MTPRENRKRRKSKRPKSDVRKVHRYGFSRRNAYGKGPKVNGPRNRLRAACGKLITDIERHHDAMPYAVPDDAFTSLPKSVQCEPCRWAGWPSTTFVPRHERSGTHEHLMAVELLVAMLQRMWQARLEVGHRCYPCPWGYCVCGIRLPVKCADCGDTVCVKPWWQHVADTPGKWRDCATSAADAGLALASAKFMCETRQCECRAGEP